MCQDKGLTDWACLFSYHSSICIYLLEMPLYLLSSGLDHPSLVLKVLNFLFLIFGKCYEKLRKN